MDYEKKGLPVSIWDGQTIFSIKGTIGESLWSLLQREGMAPDAPCAGKGLCGKCRVKIIQGNSAISKEEEQHFSKEELEQGWRLACRQRLMHPITVEVPKLKQWSEIEMADASLLEKQLERKKQEVSEKEKQSAAKVSDKQETTATESGYQIVIDLGTTTIAMALLDEQGNEQARYASLNRQRQYGADVISRIQAAVEGKAEQLRQLVIEDLEQGMCYLADKKGITLQEISQIRLAGNTTMIHLLLGYPCDTLGVYPFTPHNLSPKPMSANHIWPKLASSCMLRIFAGISTYVGGDITSGLYACGFHQIENACMLIDLGTNGEMAIGNANRILTTSVAAGPAFEGGNLSCGTGSIAGAIKEVTIENDTLHIETIEGNAAVGICGSGVISLLSELLLAEWMDETGALEEDWEDGVFLGKTKDNRELSFTQKDIREVQLAKAAVRAGIETLAVRYGIKLSEIDTIYVSGGFGCHLDWEKAIAIGLFPKEFAGRIRAVGNTSLAGCMLSAMDEKTQKNVESILEAAEEISLAKDSVFMEAYVEAMLFE